MLPPLYPSHLLPTNFFLRTLALLRPFSIPISFHTCPFPIKTYHHTILPFLYILSYTPFFNPPILFLSALFHHHIFLDTFLFHLPTLYHMPLSHPNLPSYALLSFLYFFIYAPFPSPYNLGYLLLASTFTFLNYTSIFSSHESSCPIPKRDVGGVLGILKPEVLGMVMFSFSIYIAM